MKCFLTFTILLTAATVVWCGVPQQINYQGFLTDPGGQPLDTVVSMTFTLYDAATLGTQLWRETQPSCTVRAGLFNVLLGSVTAIPDSFHYAEIWLGITVGNDSEMTPRSRAVSVGYSYRVGTVDGAAGGDITGAVTIADKANIGTNNVNSGTNAFVVGADNASIGAHSGVLSGRYNRARGVCSAVAGGGGLVVSDSNSALGDYSFVGGGRVNFAWGGYSVVNGGLINKAIGNGSFIGGGIGNYASSQFATVAGGQNDSASGYAAAVGGGRDNSALGHYSAIPGGLNGSASAYGSAVGGGENNSATGEYSAIPGGLNGSASAYGSAVGGGQNNSAAGDYSAIPGGSYNTVSGDYSAISGGCNNAVSGDFSAISGGYSNTASGLYSVISGGIANTAAGFSSSVPGGYFNQANGDFSFAAGRRAHACGGAFAWGDATDADFSVTVLNRFSARASGGVFFYTNTALTTGAFLPESGSAWISVSDSTKKRNLRLVDTKNVLDKVAMIPIKQWSYKSQNPSVEHIGPMAQDFWKAFHLGEDSLGISTIDPDGIALAAIQELKARTDEIVSLRERIEQLEKQIQRLASARTTEEHASVALTDGQAH